MKKRYTIVVLVTILLIVANSMYHFCQKSGYMCDEGMTLSLANGGYGWSFDSRKSDNNFYDFYVEYIQGDNIFETWVNMQRCALDINLHQIDGEWYQKYMSWKAEDRTTWFTGEDYKELVTVSKDTRFDYLSVQYNQYTDVHPPLYYYFVHTIFSFATNSYSNWYMYIINIVFLIGTCLFLYSIVAKYFNNRLLATITILVYGLSSGFVSTSVLFRMYAMLSFFSIWLLYQCMDLYHNEWKLGWKRILLLFINIVLGFYTQYYFIIYAAFLVIASLIYIIKDKKYYTLIKYIGMLVASAVFSYLLWPVSVKHILLSYRGKESFSNAVSGFSFEKLHNFDYQIAVAFFHGNMILLILFLLLVLVCLASKIIKKEKPNRYGVLVFVPALLYYFLIVEIAEYQMDRYIMCIFPMIAMMITFTLYKLIGLLFKDDKKRRLVNYIVFGVILLSSIIHSTANYLYKGKININQIVDASSTNCICILDGSWKMATNFNELMDYNQCVILTPDQIDFLIDNPPQDLNKPLVIEIQKGFDTNVIIQTICDDLGKDASIVEFVRGDNDATFTFLLK